MAHPLVHLGVLLLAASSLTSLTAAAQARPTADKITDVSIFLSGSFVNTDYSGSRQPGLCGGADYTLYLRKLSLGASVEGRASYTPVFSFVGQRVLSGGFRLESTHFHRFRPYGDFLAGAGKVYYDAPPNASDRAVVFTFGGGVDFDVAPRFSAKVEAGGSRWRPDPNDIRYPTMLNLGLVYHIPIARGFAH